MAIINDDVQQRVRDYSLASLRKARMKGQAASAMKIMGVDQQDFDPAELPSRRASTNNDYNPIDAKS